MQLYVGCAMWTHKPWQGRFLSASAPRLAAYAEWCNAVEGNTTFYATPTRTTTASWAAQTPPDFRMVLKIPRAIGLSLAGLGPFLHAIEPLGPRIHAVWLQLPPSFTPADLPQLAAFLRGVPSLYRYAVEVRHRGFFDDPGPLEAVLASVDAEWIPFDTVEFFARPPSSAAERDAWTKKPRMPRRAAALTDRPIVRYLGRDSIDETVAGWRFWVSVVADWLREGRSPTVFIHTPDNADAPLLARRFHDDVRAALPAVEPLPDVIPVEPPTLF